MVKRKSKGSLLGRSSSSSKDKTGLYLVSIVAIVAVVALFLMVKGGSQTSSEEVIVEIIDEEGNLVGMAPFPGLTNEFQNPPSGVSFKIQISSEIINMMKSGEIPKSSEGEEIDLFDIFERQKLIERLDSQLTDFSDSTTNDDTEGDKKDNNDGLSDLNQDQQICDCDVPPWPKPDYCGCD